MMGQFLLTNMDLIYRSVCSSSRNGGNKVKEVDEGKRYFSQLRILLLEFMKIWYNIQVIIYRLRKLFLENVGQLLNVWTIPGLRQEMLETYNSDNPTRSTWTTSETSRYICVCAQSYVTSHDQLWRDSVKFFLFSL